MSNGLIVSDSTIAAYGARDDVREVAERLMHMHPAANSVGITGMRAVAQLAIMSGANPLPSAGEIHVWEDRARVVVDFGIAYYRRIAKQKDSVIWVDEPRQMTDAERREHDVPDDALGAICRGLLLSEYERLLERGVPWEAAQKMLTRTSIATVEHSDMHYTYGNKAGQSIPPPHGRTWQWVCNKRAEKGFYRVMALVDTTLVDGMQARAERAIYQVNHGHEPPEGPPPSMSADELNSTLFDTPLPAVIVQQAQPEPADNGNGPEVINGNQLKALHIAGRTVYGDEWDDKRSKLVTAVTGGRSSSSKDLTEVEWRKLLDGIQAKADAEA